MNKDDPHLIRRMIQKGCRPASAACVDRTSANKRQRATNRNKPSIAAYDVHSLCFFLFGYQEILLGNRSFDRRYASTTRTVLVPAARSSTDAVVLVLRAGTVGGRTRKHPSHPQTLLLCTTFVVFFGKFFGNTAVLRSTIASTSDSVCYCPCRRDSPAVVDPGSATLLGHHPC